MSAAVQSTARMSVRPTDDPLVCLTCDIRSCLLCSNSAASPPSFSSTIALPLRPVDADLNCPSVPALTIQPLAPRIASYIDQLFSMGCHSRPRSVRLTYVRPVSRPHVPAGRRRRGGRAEEVRRRCRPLVECHLKQSNRIYISTRPTSVGLRPVGGSSFVDVD